MFLSALVAAGSALLMVSVQTTHQVVVGGTPEAATLAFTPNIVTANVGEIVQFVFAGAPGNHSVTQSSFAAPCQAIPGGFDSGWVFNGDPTAPPPVWNLTITTSAPVWVYCKQLKSAAGQPHCTLDMVGVINIGDKFFAEFVDAASAATTVIQTEGPLSGVGAFATAAPDVVGPSQSLLNPFASIVAPAGGASRTNEISGSLRLSQTSSLASSSATPPPSNSTPSLPSNSSTTSNIATHRKLTPTGAIVGGILGGMLVLLTGALALWWCLRRNRINPHTRFGALASVGAVDPFLPPAEQIREIRLPTSTLAVDRPMPAGVLAVQAAMWDKAAQARGLGTITESHSVSIAPSISASHPTRTDPAIVEMRFRDMAERMAQLEAAMSAQMQGSSAPSEPSNFDLPPPNYTAQV
ncbi:hypothetical protein FB45DRAFT_838288 [Roridomyces roridus]|uniref:Cupredoxin n=1 Tax=Roridomyces roridus TaxID=1738132 RepID=A0AAD7BIM2_9AGAR|nr:hypothetical protein FB45DRAFT_838288 [Roridomyces roridus]